jgi:hypothetical protein
VRITDRPGLAAALAWAGAASLALDFAFFKVTGSVVASLVFEPMAFGLGVFAILASLGRKIAVAPAVLGLIVAGVAFLVIATIAYHVGVCRSLDATSC